MLNRGHYMKWLWLLEKLTESVLHFDIALKFNKLAVVVVFILVWIYVYKSIDALEAMRSGGQPIQWEHITDWSHAGRIIKDLPVNHSFFNVTLYGADDRRVMTYTTDWHDALCFNKNHFYLNPELKEHQHHPIDVSPSRSGSISIPDKTFPVFTVLKDQSLHEWSCSFFFVFVSK